MGFNSKTKKIPAKHTSNSGDSLDQLLKLDPASSLPGYSDGLQAAYAYTPEEWREQALGIARALAKAGEPFTVRDFKDHGLPDPEVQQQWGAVIAAMHRMKIAEQIGWEGVPLKSGNVTAVRIWRGL